MKIKALKELRIATDGIGHEVQIVKVGEVVDFCDKWANSYICQGMAERVEEKAVNAAPENKAMKKAPANKKAKAKKAPKKKAK